MSKTALEYVTSAQNDLTALSERLAGLLGGESQELLDTAGDALGKAQDALEEAYAQVGSPEEAHAEAYPADVVIVLIDHKPRASRA